MGAPTGRPTPGPSPARRPPRHVLHVRLTPRHGQLARPPLMLAAPHAALRRARDLLGASHVARGTLDDARRAFERALELGQQHGDALTVARATSNLGAIATVRGDARRALALYLLAVPAYQRVGSAHGLAQTYHNMAVSLRELGRLGAADECERRAIEFARDAECPHLVALAQLSRAELSLRAGDAPLAQAGAYRAAERFDALGDAISAARARRVLQAARRVRGICR